MKYYFCLENMANSNSSDFDDGFDDALKWSHNYTHHNTKNDTQWVWIIIVVFLILIAIWLWWVYYGNTSHTQEETTIMSDLKNGAKNMKPGMRINDSSIVASK